MHRSGTSLITQLIAKWGAYMGNELMPANKYNEDGYWEYNPLVDFHEKLLRKTYNQWYAPSEIINTEELLIEFGDEARQLVERMDQSESVWCWKDPRMPLFLDFWKEILAGREVVYIISNRPPGDIATSLLLRDKMPSSVALSLWEYTTFQIFQSLANERSYKFIHYEKLILQPEISCKELFNFLNDSCLLQRNQETYQKMVYSVKKSLNHAIPTKIHLNSTQKKLLQIIENEQVPADFMMSENELLILMEKFSLYKRISQNDLTIHFAQLFFKCQDAEYDEEYSLVTEATQGSQELIFNFKSPQLVKNLRFDPLNDYVSVRIVSFQLKNNGELLKVPYTLSSNALSVEDQVYLFDTKDPKIFIECEKDISLEMDEFIVQLDYLSIGSETLEQISVFKEDAIRTQKEEIYKLSQEYETMVLHNEHLAQKTLIEEGEKYRMQILVDELSSSRKALQDQNQLKDDNIRSLEIKISEFQKTIDDLTYRLKSKKQELDSLIEIPGIRYFHRIMFSIKPYLPVESVRGVFRRLKYFRSYYCLKHSELLDEAYYLENNPDVTKSGISAAKHYLLFGGFEGRNPSEKFDSSFYMEQNPDVKASGMNPLVHYLRFGKKEGRVIKGHINNISDSLTKYSINSICQTDNSIFFDEIEKKIPHFAPPIDDYSLVVPFKYNTPVIDPPPQIAIICHLFYTDLLDEIVTYLSNIPFSYDLYISTDTEEKKKIITTGLTNWKRGRLQIKLAMNRGRDIAPKLILWPEVYKNYDFFLHIHSKKTVQESVLSGWRKHLFETLLGSPEIITSIFQAFNSNQKLGIIAPQHYSNIRHAIGWGYNYKEASLFAEQLGIKISLDDPIDFPSGSMFWARSEAISPLLKTGLRFEDFPEENGQIDNTLAHVIERMYFFVCEKAGYHWIKIVNPMQSPNTDNCLEIRDQGELYSTINKIINPLTHYRKVYINSPYSNLNFEEFVKQMELHIAGKDSSIDFDEGFYLSANKDLAKLISTGLLDSGFSHYCLSGKNENRLWSNHLIKRKYQLDPKYPEGFYAPTNIKPKQFYKPLAGNLVKSKEPFLLIMFAHLQSDLFYAGYTAFFKDFLPVFDQFEKIIISVESDFYEAKLAKRFNPKIEVINQSQLYNLKTIPDVILCFSNQLFTKAFKLFKESKKIVYYCQEYEAGFFPFGSEFIEAEKAIANSENIIISTVLLRNFLEKKNLLNDKQIFVTTPRIEPVSIKSGNWKKLFFYFRPEFFHARNIPEILWEAVHEFCQKHRGYEIYMVGSIETRFSFEINGNPIFVLNKLPTDQYNELIATCDVVIAMIYSAHPGVIAFQTAASGIPTVTNIFDNRDAATLKKISENIVPFDPLNDQLMDKIELALSMPKGRKSFDQELYSGKKGDLTLSEFILKICNH
jgi:hypothetical protein